MWTKADKGRRVRKLGIIADILYGQPHTKYNLLDESSVMQVAVSKSTGISVVVLLTLCTTTVLA